VLHRQRVRRVASANQFSRTTKKVVGLRRRFFCVAPARAAPVHRESSLDDQRKPRRPRCAHAEAAVGGECRAEAPASRRFVHIAKPFASHTRCARGLDRFEKNTKRWPLSGSWISTSRTNHHHGSAPCAHPPAASLRTADARRQAQHSAACSEFDQPGGVPASKESGMKTRAPPEHDLDPCLRVALPDERGAARALTSLQCQDAPASIQSLSRRAPPGREFCKRSARRSVLFQLPTCLLRRPARSPRCSHTELRSRNDGIGQPYPSTTQTSSVDGLYRQA